MNMLRTIQPIITARKRSCGKVMFFIGVCLYRRGFVKGGAMKEPSFSGQQPAGTHPTGMLFCLVNSSRQKIAGVNGP